MPILRDLAVELCLTVPFRLSTLVPYLHHLARPLVTALESTTELFTQGNRILDLCIDNLASENLEQFMEPIKSELVSALFKHASSKEKENSSIAAAKTLGKLGGLLCACLCFFYSFCFLSELHSFQLGRELALKPPRID